MIDLDDLRKKAEAATPGEWIAYGNTLAVVGDSGCPGCSGLLSPAHVPGCELIEIGAACPEDTSYIAAADPPTVLELIDELKRARRAARTLGKVIESQCRDIAQITNSEHMVAEDGDADWEAIWSRGYELAARAKAAEAAVARVRALHRPVERSSGRGSVCEECTRIQRDTDLTLTGGAWADSCFTSYPCATIRALDGEDA